MSFTLAVWDGNRPASHADAEVEFTRLHATYFTDREEPWSGIKQYIADATAKFPDIVDLPDDRVDDGVWSDGPLINNASGPMFYFGLVRSGVDQALPFLVWLAKELGLNCFDPQSGKLLRPS